MLAGRSAMRLGGMAVLPECQGQGIGSLTLQNVLQQADARGLAVYLSTQDERSVSFYRRMGFEVKRDALYLPGGFYTWFMLRASPREEHAEDRNPGCQSAVPP